MKRVLSVLSLFAIASVAAGAASAGVIIHTPAGLHQGDHFRIAFVTSGTIDATSSAISTYDKFVTDQADHATYAGQVIQWQAIASTPTVTANDHIGVTHDRIFLVDGTKVASDDSKIFGGFSLYPPGIFIPHLDHSINLDIHETRIEDNVWTGTGLNAEFDRLDPRFSLGGTSNFSVHGLSSSHNPSWLIAFNPYLIPRTTSEHVYGISSDLVVVPEPSSAMVFGLGALAALAYCIKRKRN